MKINLLPILLKGGNDMIFLSKKKAQQIISTAGYEHTKVVKIQHGKVLFKGNMVSAITIYTNRRGKSGTGVIVKRRVKNKFMYYSCQVTSNFIEASEVLNSKMWKESHTLQMAVYNACHFWD